MSSGWWVRLRAPWGPRRVLGLLARVRRQGLRQVLSGSPAEQAFEDPASWMAARARRDQRDQRRLQRRLAGLGVLPRIAVVLPPDTPPESVGLDQQDPARWCLLETVSATEVEAVLILQSGERLLPGAIDWLLEALVDYPQWELLYSDSVWVDARGAVLGPVLKPDWSPHLVLQPDYPGGLLLLRTGGEGGWPSAADLSGWVAHWLGRAARAQRDAVGHLPRVLVLMRRPVESETGMGDVDPLSRARWFLSERYGEAAPDCQWDPDSGSVQLAFSGQDAVCVSIIIPLRDKVGYLKACVDSILARTRGIRFELIIVDNGSVEPETMAYLEAVAHPGDPEPDGHPRIAVLRVDQPFNWSLVNNRGAAIARGDVLLFLNNDTEVLRDDWLSQLAGYARLPDVGCVGGLLLFPDGSVQHSGVVVGMNHWADHVYLGEPPGTPGPAAFAPERPFVAPAVTRNPLAITGACLCVSRQLYDTIGGLDERFLICGSDIAFGLEAFRSGRWNVLCAQARLTHHESKTRDRTVPEIDFVMSAKTYEPWRTVAVDPYYNPHLGLYRIRPLPALRTGDREV